MMGTPTKPPDARKSKRPYVPPKLVRYGDVRLLTQAQTSGSAESAMGSLPRKPASDRRFKENVVRIGTHPLGFGLYLFDYRAEFRGQHGTGRQFGVLADEVETVMPQAISLDPAGYRFVDYAMLGIYRAVGQDTSA